MTLGLGMGVRTKGRGGKAGGEVLGPELAPSFTSGLWTTSGTGVTVDASGFHFVNATNIAHAQRSSAGIEDNVTYKVQFTIANLGSPNNGRLEALIYGATTAHLGQSTTYTLANGTFTFYVTTSAAGSVTNTIRFRCSGTSGNNNFDVTFVSVRKVL